MMIGTSELTCSLSTCIGIGSSVHDLVAVFMITWRTSSSVAYLNSTLTRSVNQLPQMSQRQPLHPSSRKCLYPHLKKIWRLSSYQLLNIMQVCLVPTSKDIIHEPGHRLTILTTRCVLVMVESGLCRVKHLAYTLSLLFEVDKICGQPCTPPLLLSTSSLAFGLLNVLIEPGSIQPHPDDGLCVDRVCWRACRFIAQLEHECHQQFPQPTRKYS